MIFTKPPSLSAQVEHVYSNDDAFDTEADGFDEAYRLWLDSGDMSHLEPFTKAGQEPDVWYLKALGFNEREFASDVYRSMNIEEGVIHPGPFILACKLGLRGFKGPCDEDGNNLPFGRAKDSHHKIRYVNDETMNWLSQRDGGALVVELGVRVHSLTNPNPD